MNDISCICGHRKSSHFSRTFLNRSENWDFEDVCSKCLDEGVNGKCLGYYKAMDNLSYIEWLAKERKLV